MDRIGVAVAPSDPNIVYVISETKSEGELWRSDDAGATWRTVNRDPNINFRPFYYADIRVDPKNPNRDLLALRVTVPVGRRRHHVPHDRARRARRPSGDVDRSAQPESRPQRIRRRLAGQLRRQQDVRGREHVPVHAVLPHQLRHAAPVHGVRRAAGQRQLVWAEPDAVAARATERPTGTRCRAATASSPCR